MPNTGLPGNIWFPDDTAPAAPFENLFAQQAASVNVALTSLARISSTDVNSQAERDALFPSPVQGNRVFRRDLGTGERYFGVYNVSTNPQGKSTAGWRVDETTWIQPSLSGWTHQPSEPLQYARINGIVQFRGRMSANTASPPSPFTLPDGFRPSGPQVNNVWVITNQPRRAVITNAGVITTDVNVISEIVSFANITFQAA